jgi:hypothetical protein
VRHCDGTSVKPQCQSVKVHQEVHQRNVTRVIPENLRKKVHCKLYVHHSDLFMITRFTTYPALRWLP